MATRIEQGEAAVPAWTGAAGRAPRASAGGRVRVLLRDITPLGVLIWIYILVGVGRVHEHLSFLVPLHPGLLTFFLIVGYVVLNPQSIDLSNMWRTWPGWVVMFLGVWSVLSGVFGISLGATARFIIEEYASLLIFATIMVSAVGRLPLLRAVMLAWVCAAAFWLYLSYLVLPASNQGVIGGIARLEVEYTYDPNDICVIFNTSVPLALLFFRSAANKWVRRASLLVALGVPGAVALSGSRGGLVGLVVTAAALLYVVREVSFGKKVAGVVVTVLGLLVMAPEGYWRQMGTVLNIQEDYNWTDPFGRKAVLERGLGYVLQFPVFGLGANNFGRAEGTIGPLALNHVSGTALRFMAPHNTLLQVAADMGIPALLAWLSVVWLGIFWVWRQRRRFAMESPDPDERFMYQVCTYLPVAWLAFTVTTLFVSFAYAVPFYILLAYTVGVILAVRRWLATPEQRALEAAASAAPAAGWRSLRPLGGRLPWTPLPGVSPAPEPGDGLAEER